MDETLRMVLADLAEEGRLNDAREQERSKKMLNLPVGKGLSMAYRRGVPGSP